MRTVRSLVISVLVAALVLVGSPDAGAVYRGEINISPTSGPVTKTYPAIPAVRPNACEVSCTTPYAQTQSPGCKSHNGAYCDATHLNISKPDGYGDDLYQVIVTLSWAKGATNNKLNLYVFAKEDPLLGPSLVDNRTDDNPKSVKIFAPDKGTLYMTIINERGINSGYRLNVEWQETDIPTFYAPARKSEGAASVASARASSRSGVSPAYTAPQGAPAVRPSRDRKVLVPGPDGEMVEMTLPTVARGNRTAAKHGSVDLVTALVVGILLSAGGVFGVVMIRRRRSSVGL